MNRLLQRRYPTQGIYTSEQAHELAGLSFAIGRQIGLLIDRQGRPRLVIVGEPGSILIPELDRSREASGRLRGVRLLHTHLDASPLSEEDLTDMLFLRLDSLAALTVDADGQPQTCHVAHLLPANPERQAYRVFPPVPWDRVDLDLGAVVLALEDEFSRTTAVHAAGDGDRCVLVSIGSAPKAALERSLDELAELARTAGVEVVGRLVQRVSTFNPKYIVGKGKLAELEVAALQSGAGLVIFDQELSPAQMRNLANVTERRILDRTQLILDIFARHATSRAGKLQVEMAQLKYASPPGRPQQGLEPAHGRYRRSWPR